MKTIANLIVLIFEIMFYSIYTKNIKGEGKLSKYILTFIVGTIGLMIAGNGLFSYLAFALLCLLGIKYIVKVKTSFFDFFMIIIMLLIKAAIETALCIVCFVITKNTFISLMIANVVKMLFVCKNRVPMRNYYQVLRKLWNSNNFYFRYILMSLLYIYIICSALFLIYR